MASIAVTIRRAFSGLLLFLVLAGAADAGECRQPLYLTLDVGNMRHAEYIADVLKQEHVLATFFIANNRTVRGDHVLDAGWGNYWRERVSEGHAFGNHTWSHFHARQDKPGAIDVTDRSGKHRLLNKQQYCAQFSRVNNAFEHLTGRSLSPMWRAPGGHTTANSIRWAAECGYPLHVDWSKAGLLGDELPSDRFPNDLLVRRAIRNLHSGDVLMMHLGIRSRKQPLAESLQPLIRGLKARGFCFRPLDPGR